MHENKYAIETTWIDSDDTPELTDEWFKNATSMINERVVSKGEFTAIAKKHYNQIVLKSRCLKNLLTLLLIWKSSMHSALPEQVGKCASTIFCMNGL